MVHSQKNSRDNTDKHEQYLCRTIKTDETGNDILQGSETPKGV